jgi:SAM-dependent methyltransferase
MNTEGQWQLTGSAAERYERVLAPAILAPWAADLVELAQLQDGERVLDVACGTGVVTRHAAQKVRTAGRVTGLDLNQGMVEVARSLPPVPGAAPIIWIAGSALAMHLPDAAFDVVLCQQGVQFFPDRPAALREMRRVLVPGGRVLVSIWAGPTPYSVALWNAVERHVGPDAAATFRKSRVGQDPEVLRQLMAQTGFRDVQIRARTRTTRLPAVAEFVLRHLAASPVDGAVDALPNSAREALAEEVSTALRPYGDGEGVAFPETTNVVMALR